MGEVTVQMSREQGFLETFFLSLSQFSYDKAKELADKEREAIKTQIGSVWHSMLLSLGQLAVMEKSYMSLSFLAAKGFLRKDNSLKSSYELVRLEFCRMDENGKSSNSESLENLLVHLCGQLVHFVSYRLDLIDLYEKMYNIGSTRSGSCEALQSQVSVILQGSQGNFHHPCLNHLKNTFSYECEALSQLLSCQVEMQQWAFLPSLLHLHAAHAKLNSWGSLSQPRENRRLSFSPGFLKPPQLPLLYQWLVRFKAFSISKFTLYFHEILSRKANQQEIKSLCSKLSVDLYHKLVTFQRKSDAVCVALVFDARGSEGYKGHGYHHPDKAKETPKGLDCFPTVVCYPGTKPSSHWPNIIMTMEANAWELNMLDRIKCFYDKVINSKQMQCTYLIVRVEQRMTLVIIFTGKRSDKESSIASFVEEFCSHLRFHKILLTLRSGNK